VESKVDHPCVPDIHHGISSDRPRGRGRDDPDTRREFAIQSREWKCPQCSLTLESDPIPEVAPLPGEQIEAEPVDGDADLVELSYPTLMAKFNDEARWWAVPYFDIPIIIVLVILVVMIFIDDTPRRAVDI
jgi:hypothetical protein